MVNAHQMRYSPHLRIQTNYQKLDLRQLLRSSWHRFIFCGVILLKIKNMGRGEFISNNFQRNNRTEISKTSTTPASGAISGTVFLLWHTTLAGSISYPGYNVFVENIDVASIAVLINTSASFNSHAKQYKTIVTQHSTNGASDISTAELIVQVAERKETR